MIVKAIVEFEKRKEKKRKKEPRFTRCPLRTETGKCEEIKELNQLK